MAKTLNIQIQIWNLLRTKTMSTNQVSRVAPPDSIYIVTGNIKHGTAFKTVKDSKTGKRYYQHTVMPSDLGLTPAQFETKKQTKNSGQTRKSGLPVGPLFL